jgi:hypothetical protein
VSERARSTLTLVAIAASVAGLGACGGDDDSTSSGPATMKEQPREVVSPRSAPFQKYSGDGPGELRIAEFGTEGSRSDRLEVQAAVDDYLRATGSGKWGEACAYASVVLRSQIDEIIRNAKQTPKPTCGEVLEALATPPSGVPLADVAAPERIASLRIKEEAGGGFALFRGNDGMDYWMAVRSDDGVWRVLSPAPQAFSVPPSRSSAGATAG